MAGWSKRTKTGNVTTTINTEKGVTTTTSSGSKGNRLTGSHKPNGSLVVRQTMTTAAGTRTTSRTINPSRRKKKTSTKKLKFTWTEIIILAIILFVLWGYN